MHPFDAFKQNPFPRKRSFIERLADVIVLNRFFLREGKQADIRVDDDVIVSSAESKIAEIQTLRSTGEIHGKHALGRQENYSFEDIVHDDAMKETFDGGLCFNQYLSPFNIHYLLFPTELTVKRMDYHPAFCRPIVFMKSGETRNERLVLYCEAKNGTPLVIVLVGSFLVSGIECLAHEGGRYKSAELMGGFKLGSTVMMLFPKDTVEPIAHDGDKLILGEPIARFL